MAEQPDGRTGRAWVLWAVAAVAVIAGLGAAYSSTQVQALEGQLESAQRQIADLEERVSETAGESDELRRQVAATRASIGEIESDSGDIVSFVGSVERQLAGDVDDLWGELYDLSDRIDERLQDLGRCLYHEAEQNYYQYWYSTTFSGERYITSCD